jgi:hypothetical protein
VAFFDLFFDLFFVAPVRACCNNHTRQLIEMNIVFTS